MQLVWGAVLAVSLQQRSLALAGGRGIAGYAALAAGGAAIAVVVQLLAGRASDARVRAGGGRRGFQAAGAALAAAALLWFYLSPTYAGLACAFCALQVGMNVAGGPYAAIVSDYVALGRRGRASSWLAGLGSLGNAAGLLLAGFVRAPVPLALAIAAALLGAWSVTDHAMRRLGRPGVTAAAVAVRRPAGAARSPLAVLLLSRGLVNVGFFTLLGFLLFFVRDALGVRGAALETQTALLFLTFTLAGVAGAALAAGPSDRRDLRAVASTGAGIVALALAGLAAAPGLAAAYAAAAVAGAGWGGFVTADWALATRVLPPGAMGGAMGVWNVATALPQVVAPLATAPLVLRLDAVRAGLGPRGAVVLALVEIASGAALVWLLPAPALGAPALQQREDPVGHGEGGMGAA